jgi:hypothetical protein
MPFNCPNTTKHITDACGSLLIYCNNNYSLRNQWCNCIDDNYSDNCSINLLIVLGIPLIIIGGISLLFSIACLPNIIQRLKKYKIFNCIGKKVPINTPENITNIQLKNSSQPPRYDIPEWLIPQATSVRNIPKIDNTSVINLDYKPPEYNSITEI